MQRLVSDFWQYYFLSIDSYLRHRCKLINKPDEFMECVFPDFCFDAKHAQENEGSIYQFCLVESAFPWTTDISPTKETFSLGYFQGRVGIIVCRDLKEGTIDLKMQLMFLKFCWCSPSFNTPRMCNAVEISETLIYHNKKKGGGGKRAFVWTNFLVFWGGVNVNRKHCSKSYDDIYSFLVSYQKDGCDFICRCQKTEEVRSYKGLGDDQLGMDEDEDRDENILPM